MKPLDALKAVGNVAGTIGKNFLQARETRTQSPAFRAEMAQENKEFFHTLNELGSHTWNLGVGAILKTPYQLLVNALKVPSSGKYDLGHFTTDALKLFLGKNGVAHNTLKVTASALHLGAKTAKIGVRKLFAL